MKFFFKTFIYVGKTPGELTVNVYIDGQLAKTKFVMIGATGTSGMGISSIGVDKIGVGGGALDISDTGGGDFIEMDLNQMGRDIQVEISDNNGTKSFEINALHFQYKPLSIAFQPNTK